ncbi:efflux RND transporter periplasmic adaptor subunit [Ornithinibacillus californiensis]|uniref:efflux RND transporter periplasmic adaptor subunit n=1 Tax=Ornithinibacillus californiensis TaxID=161536 RepID=UPI00064DB8ED|nr:efflux RND transporter periplasmic adaptor subunit [Ornithinibacillus californiensis]
MRKKIKWFALIAFIVINSLLIWLDDGDKVERLAYIPTWERVYQADLYETVEAEGVVSYSGESYVYFDKELGSFDGFLVEEGATVKVGDPLFQYQVHDYAETEALLTYELEKVNGEIDAIENAITEMVAFRIPTPSVPVVAGDEEEDGTTVVVAPEQPVEAEVMKEQFIIQKEQELAAKQEQERIIQSQLDDLQSTGAIITVESPFEGKIKEISSTLSDPIIRVEHTSLLVKGDIGESARVEVEVEQPVEVVLKENGQTLLGFITNIKDSPYEVEVDSKSIYPIEVGFKEGQVLDTIYPGYHADLTITVNESIQANTVDTSMVQQHHVWRMNDSGKVELVPVQTGILMGDQLEVISGLAHGNVITEEEIHSDFSGMPFITPLKISHVPWLTIGQGDWLAYMTKGIIVR